MAERVKKTPVGHGFSLLDSQRRSFTAFILDLVEGIDSYDTALTTLETLVVNTSVVWKIFSLNNQATVAPPSPG